MDDRELLSDYVRTGSQSAFTEIVARHIDWVYGACRRRVVDPALAEDVTQAVFIVLAKKAKTLGEKVVLVGWLMNAIHFASADALKRQARRREHERRAAAMKSTESAPAEYADTADIIPHVDEALNQLPAAYRDAIALRFYCHRSYAEIAVALGVHEAAAKKRVSRGLEKLRTILRSKGGMFTVASLTAALAAAAPAELQAQVISVATTGQAGLALAIAQGTLQLMEFARLKITVPLAVAALGISALTCVVCQFGGELGGLNQPSPPAMAAALKQRESPQLPAPQAWPDLDRSLLRFTDKGGAFEQFHLAVPIQALPGRDIAPVEVVVERNGEAGALLVTTAREGLPFAYVAGDLLVQLDEENPGGLVAATGARPGLVVCAQQSGNSMMQVRVAAAAHRQIDVNLGSLLDCLQADAALLDRDEASLRFLSSKGGGRFFLAAERQPGTPPLSGFCVTEYVRLAVQIRQINVGAGSTTLPHLTLPMIEGLGLSVRQIPAPQGQRDLLPPAGFFDHAAHRATAARLRTLIQGPDKTNPNVRQLASAE